MLTWLLASERMMMKMKEFWDQPGRYPGAAVQVWCMEWRSVTWGESKDDRRMFPKPLEDAFRILMRAQGWTPGPRDGRGTQGE